MQPGILETHCACVWGRVSANLSPFDSWERNLGLWTKTCATKPQRQEDSSTGWCAHEVMCVWQGQYICLGAAFVSGFLFELYTYWGTVEMKIISAFPWSAAGDTALFLSNQLKNGLLDMWVGGDGGHSVRLIVSENTFTTGQPMGADGQ
jgi:hypothetical protein